MALYRDENLRLHSLVSAREAEVEQKDTAIQELMTTMPQTGNARLFGPRGETHLVAALRRQIAEIAADIHAKEERMRTLAQSPHVTRLREMEAEERICRSETERLRRLVQTVVSQKLGGYSQQQVAKMEESVYQQDILISAMREDNCRLASSLQAKDEEVRKLSVALEGLQAKADKYLEEHHEGQRNGRSLRITSRQMQKLRGQLKKLKTETGDKALSNFQTKLEQILKRQAELSAGLAQREKTVRELEGRISVTREKRAVFEAECGDLRAKIENCSIFVAIPG